MMGLVALVGSGPGDPGLLTLRAAELLAQADVVVYDHLANFNFLSHLRPSAELVNVGKRSNHHTLPQEKINQLLVDLATQGKRVVRLKGGDPYVFGRGGEEAEFLVAQGIPFEVVSGVTSAVAVPAAAGIPITHRDHCTSFHVITGHERAERGESALDFALLAKLSGTLIFLMGLTNLETITQQLMAEGKSPQTPIAVISRGCSTRQRQILGTLKDIASLVKEQGIEAPAVTVVGSVANLAEVLRSSRPRLPLQGQRILVTRTRTQAGRLSAKLRAQGADVLEIPLIRIEASNEKPMWGSLCAEIPKANWLVLTSENGVEIFLNGLCEHHLDLRKLAQVRIAAIGPATASKLQKAGLIADLVPSSYTVDALTQELLPRLSPQSRLLLARADIANPSIAEALQQAGHTVTEYPIYKTQPEHSRQSILRDLLEQGSLD
ncbi:MAG TPA: uroporphyrinogen-III C-methyltransferase, partial [Fibrobacteraceae bacterium]|nr:uroporphyrinogen-III C-methyltransferase [Fibrobacteraceae bacterium]